MCGLVSGGHRYFPLIEKLETNTISQLKYSLGGVICRSFVTNMKTCTSFFLGGHFGVLVSCSTTCNEDKGDLVSSLTVPQKWPLHHQLG